MAVFRGGTLVQDLLTLWPEALEHERSDLRERAVHPVELAPDSRLAALVGQTSIEVNSTHHQAIHQPGQGVRSVGWAPDGVVEAIEDPSQPFWLGVQWHPERLDVSHSARIFEGLVEAARRDAASP
jgi:putative glutamine amidotransferase